MVVVDYVVGGLHQHGTDLGENPGRGAGIQGHNTAVSTEHNLVDPVPDEESKVPGDLPIRNLGVQHFLSFDRTNRGRLGTEGVEPPELSLHLLRRLWDTLSLVTVTLKGTAAGGHPTASWVTEQIWKEGEVKREMCFSLLRYNIQVLVTVSREEDFLLNLHGSVQQKERLARKQLLSDVALSYPVIGDHRQSQPSSKSSLRTICPLGDEDSHTLDRGVRSDQTLLNHAPQGEDEVS